MKGTSQGAASLLNTKTVSKFCLLHIAELQELFFSRETCGDESSWKNKTKMLFINKKNKRKKVPYFFMLLHILVINRAIIGETFITCSRQFL